MSKAGRRAIGIGVNGVNGVNGVCRIFYRGWGISLYNLAGSSGLTTFLCIFVQGFGQPSSMRAYGADPDQNTQKCRNPNGPVDPVAWRGSPA